MIFFHVYWQLLFISIYLIHYMDAQRVPNPDYIGPWVHPMIDNPEYDKDAKLAYKNAFIGFDLWYV